MKAKKKSKVPFAIVHHFPGGTEKQYEASIEALHPGKGILPKGQLIHAAGESADGWTILAVHDSKESWEQFRDEILMPRFKKGIKGGFTTMPQQTEISIHNLVI